MKITEMLLKMYEKGKLRAVMEVSHMTPKEVAELIKIQKELGRDDFRIKTEVFETA